MIKKLAVLLYFINFFLANAQTKIGVKAGINISNIGISTANAGAGSIIRPDFYGGIFIPVRLTDRTSFIPTLEFSKQGANVNSGSDLVASGNYVFNYINIPFLVRLKILPALFVQTGPQIGLLLNAKIDQTNYGTSGFNSFDFGWVLGIGCNLIKNFGIDGHYNYGLSNINSSSNGIKFKNQVIQFGIYYVFHD